MNDGSVSMGVFRSIVDRSPDLVSLSGFDSRVHFVNRAGLDLVGLPDLATAQATTAGRFFTPVGLVRAASIVDALQTEGSWRGESELRDFVTGESIPVSVVSFVVDGPDGESLIASIQRDLRSTTYVDREPRSVLDEAAHLAAEQHAIADISRLALRGSLDDVLRAATDAALTLIGAQCSSVLRPSDDALITVAYSGNSPRPQRLPIGSGSQPGHALAVGLPVVCVDRDTERRFATDSMVARRLRSGVSVPIEGDGAPWGVLTVHSSVSREYTKQEVSFLGTVCDVLSAAVRRIELEEHLRHIGQHDPLTGLPNRTLAHQNLGRLLADSAEPISLFLVDFDNFKSVNDHFGHEIGDVALVAVAQRLNEAVSVRTHVGGKWIARLGGDEFLVVCTDISDATAAEAMANSIVDWLKVPLTIEGRQVPLSASIGIALSEKNIDVATLLHRADVAMYRAKSASTGSYAVYDADDERQARHHLTMSTDLRAAIENKGLALRYRPTVDTSSADISFFAAQPIWEHPALGRLSAADFTATADRTGLVRALGAWVLRSACTDAALWQKRGPVGVRVDVLPGQILQAGFVSDVEAAITAADLPADRLVIAVPEHALSPVDGPIRSVLAELDALGVLLLLDNNSGGHSSIRNLQLFREFDFFQLDSADVDATFREHAAVVLQAVVALIHAIGASVIADGVHDSEHLDGVGALGCDLAVGEFFGPGVTAAEAAALIPSGMSARPAH